MRKNSSSFTALRTEVIFSPRFPSEKVKEKLFMGKHFNGGFIHFYRQQNLRDSGAVTPENRQIVLDTYHCAKC